MAVVANADPCKGDSRCSESKENKKVRKPKDDDTPGKSTKGEAGKKRKSKETKSDEKNKKSHKTGKKESGKKFRKTKTIEMESNNTLKTVKY